MDDQDGLNVYGVVPSGFDHEMVRVESEVQCLSYLRYARLLLSPGRPVRLLLPLLVPDVGHDVGNVDGRGHRRRGRNGLRRRRGGTLMGRFWNMATLLTRTPNFIVRIHVSFTSL